MPRKKSVKLGLCPIGKFVFSHKDAIVQKNKLLTKLREFDVEIFDLDMIIPDGIIKKNEDIEKTVRYFLDNEIDAVFLPHVNFGTEAIVGLVAKQLSIPTLLWAPRDEAPLADGSRLRDSLCGCFASSKVLQTLGIKFEYIENSRVDDPVFIKELGNFISAVRVAKALKSARIGQIGMRIDFFWSTIIDEADLLRKFGVEIIPFDMVEFIEHIRIRLAKNEATYRAELADLRRSILDAPAIPDEGMLLSLASRDEMLEMAQNGKIDAFALQSFNSLQESMGPGCGLGLALAEEEIPIAAETDLHGALSSILVEAAADYESPSFFPEFVQRHPENDNAVLLWHASAPPSLRHPETGKIAILPPWILKNLPATSLQFGLKEGDLTVCRFDGNHGEYRLGFGEGRVIPGPKTREVYAWYEVDDWPSWEKQIIKGPYIHHCSAIYGRHGDVLEAACNLIPGLKAERFGGERNN